MKEDDLEESDQNYIKKACLDLEIYYDSVIIIATKRDPDTKLTTLFSDGVGNWYARYGSVSAWLKDEESKMNPPMLIDGEEEEGEDWKDTPENPDE